MLLLALVPLLVQGSNRIHGGTTAKPEKYPFIAKLLIGGQTCTGSMFNGSRYVITAKHCFTTTDSSTGFAVFNDFDRNYKEENEKRVRIIGYKAYGEAWEDLAVAELEKKVDDVPSVKIYKRTLKAGYQVRAVGYGMMGLRIEPRYLRDITLTVASTEGDFIETSAKENNHGPCQGDSGGPLLVWEEGSWAIVATLSGGGYNCQYGTRSRSYPNDIWNKLTSLPKTRQTRQIGRCGDPNWSRWARVPCN